LKVFSADNVHPAHHGAPVTTIHHTHHMEFEKLLKSTSHTKMSVGLLGTSVGGSNLFWHKAI
jgi:hypothetical protein